MDKHNKNMTFAYKPYRKEALYCFIVDLLILLLACLAAVLLGVLDKLPVVLLLCLPLWAIEIILNYRLGLLSIIEQRQQLIIRQRVKIIEIKEEYSFSGHWGSIVPSFYPKELKMQRYKLKCIGTNMKTFWLRTVISPQKAQRIREKIDKGDVFHFAVWGKFTHILLSSI